MSQAALSESFDPTIPLPISGPTQEEHGSLAMLLQSPHSFARLVAQDKFDWRSSLILLATALGFSAVYGLAMGVFAGGNALWQATLKAPLMLIGSVGVCAPSLYLLLAVSGAMINVRQTAALLAGMVCLSSLLMVAFAPVAWLFGMSTSNVQFMVLLHVLVWSVSMGCGLRLLLLAIPHGEGKSLLVWAGIFLLVSAQMSTYLRPLLGVSPTGSFREHRRQFFFQHFYASMVGEKLGRAPADSAPLPAPTPAPAPGFAPAPSPRPMSN